MTQKLQYYMPRFMPYLIIGITIAFFLYLLPILSRIFLFGLAIGTGLWVLKCIQQHFTSVEPKVKKGKGRIIDYEE